MQASIFYAFARLLSSVLEIRRNVEHQFVTDTTDEAKIFLARHPELADDYQQWMSRLGNTSADDRKTRVRD